MRYGFHRCSKAFNNGGVRRVLLNEATLLFDKDERIAVLGGQGSGKTSILKMLGGLDKPSSGSVFAPPNISWPFGMAGPLHPSLTGLENVRSLAAMLRADPDEVAAFCTLFGELDDAIARPVSEYSNGMRARLAATFSLAVPRDFYLADEVIGTGSPEFRKKCERMMLRRLEEAGLLIVTRNPRVAETFADRFFVIANGGFVECADKDEATRLLEEQNSTQTQVGTMMSGLYEL